MIDTNQQQGTTNSDLSAINPSDGVTSEAPPSQDFSNEFLRQEDLSQRDFTGSCFKNADMRDSNLEGSTFKGVNFEGADLTRCNLADADFSGANLEGAILRKAVLFGTNFKSANLKNADLSMSKMYDFKVDQFGFRKTRVVNFENATLAGVNFQDTTLSEHVDMEGKDLKGANFKGVDLRFVSFKKSELEGADFTDANMFDTNMEWANISKAVFTNAKTDYLKCETANTDGVIDFVKPLGEVVAPLPSVD